MDDITIALETVRTAVEWSYQRRVRATLPALSTIEAELTRLREQAAINEKATRARNLMLEGREDEAKAVWSE